MARQSISRESPALKHNRSRLLPIQGLSHLKIEDPVDIPLPQRFSLKLLACKGFTQAARINNNFNQPDVGSTIPPSSSNDAKTLADPGRTGLRDSVITGKIDEKRASDRVLG